jgi:signal transduction histidine kinase
VSLSQLIHQHRERIVGRWAQKVIERLALESTRPPQLINALPSFLQDVAEFLELPQEDWGRSEGAASHGRHRVEMGLDIGGLAEEFGMVAETIFEVADQTKFVPSLAETAALTKIIAKGAAESVRAYARLRDQQVAAEASRHFSFVAHELRTPLQTARLATQLISGGYGDTQALLDRLTRAHDELSDLIDNSLLEARLQGEPQLHVSPQATHALMNEAIANVHVLAARRNVALTVDGEDVAVVVDRKLIVSAITNLVVNAIKFSHEGAQVTLRSRATEERVLIEVDDCCGGLPEDVPGRLFQPFVQAATDGSGFGLGLMIVKQAVDAHQGSVRVVNLPPQGCRFVIELLAPAPAEG